MTELPQHIGVVMDGNRRWAKAHGVPTHEGHRAGFEALFALVPAIKELGIPYVTVYAFSTENWLRSKAEVNGILKLLLWVVKNRLKAFKKEGIRIRIVGSKDGIPSDALSALETAEAETADGTTMTLGVCFNYGGQQEIVDAYKKILEANVAPEELTAEAFANYIYEPEIPAIDLLIRTSGEQRLSGFMLWRAAYAELYFTEKMWPDFSPTELTKALDAYAERQRRYGA